jgi:hypothetical protein
LPAGRGTISDVYKIPAPNTHTPAATTTKE